MDLKKYKSFWNLMIFKSVNSDEEISNEESSNEENSVEEN